MQTIEMPLRHPPMRQAIREWIQSRIVLNQFQPGLRLKDSEIAAELGVSRTPVRETLVSLANEGLVVADPNRGFSVAPLNRRDVIDVYPVISTLESLALASLAPAGTTVIDDLKRINSEFASVRDDALRLQELDLAWHQVIAVASGNQYIANTLSTLKLVSRRYECLYMQSPTNVKASVHEHRQIIDSLVQGKTAQARRQIEMHWKDGQQKLLSSLDT